MGWVSRNGRLLALNLFRQPIFTSLANLHIAPEGTLMSKRSLMLAALALFFVASCGDDDPVAPSGQIALNPSTVEFAAAAGGDDPDVETVAITNTGGGTLSALAATITYETGEPTGWLATTLSGTTAPATLTLTPTTGDLPPGTYNATVNVAASGAANSPRPVTVTFTVVAAHTFQYTPPDGAPAITSIFVPGEHNEWNEEGTPMTLDNGVWSVTVPLAPGTHLYKFRINGAWVVNMCDDETWGHPDEDNWVDLGATGCEDDGLGGQNAYIEIE